jgi:hypothetical protein
VILILASHAREIETAVSTLKRSGQLVPGETYRALLLAPKYPPRKIETEEILLEEKFGFKVGILEHRFLIGKVIDAWARIRLQQAFEGFLKGVEPPRLVTVGGLFGWRAILIEQLRVMFAQKTQVCLIPEGLSIFQVDKHSYVDRWEAVRRYGGTARDLISGPVSSGHSAIAISPTELFFRLIIRVFVVLFLGRPDRNPIHGSQVDLLIDQWPKASLEFITNGPSMRRQSVGLPTELEKNRRVSDFTLVLHQNLPFESEKIWQVVFESLSNFGLKKFLLKQHPNSVQDDSFTVAAKEFEYSELSFGPVEDWLVSNSPRAVVGVTSTALFFSKANFPADPVISVAQLIAQELPRKEADELIDKMGFFARSFELANLEPPLFL